MIFAISELDRMGNNSSESPGIGDPAIRWRGGYIMGDRYAAPSDSIFDFKFGCVERLNHLRGRLHEPQARGAALEA